MQSNTARDISQKIEDRRQALKRSSRQTRIIQGPIVNPYAVKGHANPSGLGHAPRHWWNIRQLFREVGKIFHRVPLAQSSVLFPSLETYLSADETGRSPYGGAEYAIPLSPEAAAVSKKIAELYHSQGTVICPSGLSAITTTFNTFDPKLILLPDNVYFPAERFLTEKRPDTRIVRYPAGASAEDFAAVLAKANTGYAPDKMMVYMEAPGSGTFEIPDIEGITKVAKQQGIRVVMDNTWGSFVRCDPLKWGIDVVIEATTKYAGGYGDTPSGVIVAAHKADHEKLARELRVAGHGAVPSVLCDQLNDRLDSARARLDQQAATASKLMDWFLRQDFVAEVLSPALKTSPYHDRFTKYFGQGNGLFSVVFKEGVSPAQVSAFNDALNFFHVGESWGGHVSLVLPAKARHVLSEKPKGTIYRYHAGLEAPKDLLRDLDQAAQRIFGTRPEPKPQKLSLGLIYACLRAG